MNRAIFWRLVWKEYRVQRSFWVAMVFMALVGQLLILWLPHQTETWRTVWLFRVGLALGAFYALGCGATLFAAEHEAATFPFQRALPVSAARVFGSKLAFAGVSTGAMLAAVWLLSVLLARWQLPSPQDHLEVWGLWGVAAVELLAWSTFFSLLSTRPLVAVILGVACASLCVDLLSGSGRGYWNLSIYAQVVPRRLAVVGLVALADVWLGFRFFREAVARPGWWRRLRRRFARLEAAGAPRVEAAETAGAFAAALPSRGVIFGRLLWHHWRQSRRLIFTLAAVVAPAVLWNALWPFLQRAYQSTSWKPWAFDTAGILFGLAGIAVIPLSGACVFLADQTQSSFRYLADRGVGPGLVWLSRQLVWASAVTIGTAAAIGVVACTFKHLEAWNLIAAVAVGYASGQLCSMLLRNGIVAAALSMVLTVLIGLWTILMYYLDLSWLWSVAPLVAAFLVATRLRTRDWLLERGGLRAWLRAGLPIGLTAAGVFTAVIAVRVYEVPRVELGFSPEEFARPRTAEEEETLALYRRAVKMYVHPVWSPSDDTRPRKVLRVGSEEFAVADDEPAWLKANEKTIAMAIEISRRPSADFFDPTGREGTIYDVWRLANLLVASGRRLHVEGKLDEAWGRYLAALRVSVHLRQRSWSLSGPDGVEWVVYRLLPHWAAWPGQTPQRIAAALRGLEQVLSTAPSRCEAVKAEYVFAQRLMRASAEELEQLKGMEAVLEAKRLAAHWMPWEPVRARRLLDYSTALAFESCRRAEERLAAGEAPLLPDVELTSDYARLMRLARTTPEFVGTASYNLGHSIRNLVQVETTCRVTRLILAIQAYKLQHGRLPKTLQELVGPYFDRLPNDPYAGEPFRWFPEGLPFSIPALPDAPVHPADWDPRRPLLWSAGEHVRVERSDIKTFRRYVVRNRNDRRKWLDPYSETEVWETGWGFLLP